jgi:hypothetical protein
VTVISVVRHRLQQDAARILLVIQTIVRRILLRKLVIILMERGKKVTYLVKVISVARHRLAAVRLNQSFVVK